MRSNCLLHLAHQVGKYEYWSALRSTDCCTTPETQECAFLWKAIIPCTLHFVSHITYVVSLELHNNHESETKQSRYCFVSVDENKARHYRRNFTVAQPEKRHTDLMWSSSFYPNTHVMVPPTSVDDLPGVTRKNENAVPWVTAIQGSIMVSLVPWNNRANTHIQSRKWLFTGDNANHSFLIKIKKENANSVGESSCQ